MLVFRGLNSSELIVLVLFMGKTRKAGMTYINMHSFFYFRYLDQRLPKKERLTSAKEVSEVFQSGKGIFTFPVLLKFQIVEEKNPAKSPILFACTVPRKKIKKATDRNLIKRRIRETYRINKHILSPKLHQINGHLRIVIVYQAEKELPYHQIEAALKKAFFRLLTEKL